MPQLGFGVHLISRGEGDPATSPFPSHRLMAEDGVRVEKLGYDSVWLPDHYYFDRPAGIETFPEVWTLLTTVALKTEKVRLGTNVLSATFRHPGMMAKMAGAIQEVAEGRFILGIGAGNQVNENTAFGHNFANRVGSFKEYLPIMTGLLNGETVNFEGRYFTMKDASLRTFVPDVPVWVASGGPQMWSLTARYGTGWNMAGGGVTAAGIQEKYDGFSAACQAAGKNVKDFDVCKMTFMAVATDDANAKRMREELATKSNLTPDALATRMVVDTPAGLTKWLRTLSEIGVTHHIFSVSESEQWPNYWDSVEYLMKEVVPAVRA